jgi:hypothetical protein
MPGFNLFDPQHPRHEKAFFHELNRNHIISFFAEDAGRAVGFTGDFIKKLTASILKPNICPLRLRSWMWKLTAGFFYSPGLLKSIPTGKDRAQLPDPYSKNPCCSLSII